MDEHDQVRQSVLPNHYSESSDQIRSETINTDQNENTSQPTLNLHLPGGSSQYNAGSMDETPRSPDSGQIAFQKRIQDTLISTAERQLESFRNQNHLQFRNIRNFITVDGTLKNKVHGGPSTLIDRNGCSKGQKGCGPFIAPKWPIYISHSERGKITFKGGNISE